MTRSAPSILWTIAIALMSIGVLTPFVTLAAGGWLARSTTSDEVTVTSPSGTATVYSAEVDMNGFVLIPSALALVAGVALGVVAATRVTVNRTR